MLTVELPGFDLDDIAVSWDDGVRASGASAGSADGPRASAGVLNATAEHEDEQRGQQKTYHRRFRFPKRIDEAEIDAEYTNGVLEITLPVETGRPRAAPRSRSTAETDATTTSRPYVSPLFRVFLRDRACPGT